MGSERRGRAVHGRLEVNPSGEEPTDRPRQKNAGLWEPYETVTGSKPESTGAVRLLRRWRVHQKGLLTWENAVERNRAWTHVRIDDFL